MSDMIPKDRNPLKKLKNKEEEEREKRKEKISHTSDWPKIDVSIIIHRIIYSH